MSPGADSRDFGPRDETRPALRPRGAALVAVDGPVRLAKRPRKLIQGGPDPRAGLLAARRARDDVFGGGLEFRAEALGRLIDLLALLRREILTLGGDLLEVIPDRLEIARHVVNARRRNRERGEIVHSLLDVRACVADPVLGLLLVGLATRDRQRGKQADEEPDHPGADRVAEEHARSVIPATRPDKHPRSERPPVRRIAIG